MSTLEEEILQQRDALAEETSMRRASDIVSRIKNLTQQQLRALDPETYIEDTNYFNHSAIPDFVVRWHGNRESRNVFLRPSYLEVMASNDISRADTSASIIVSLDPRHDLGDPTDLTVDDQSIGEAAAAANSTLISDVSAIEALSATDTAAAQSPLAAVVRQNFVSGGRRWIGRDRAARLVAGSSVASDGESLSSIVRDNFVQEAVLRMSRTAAIVDLVRGRSEQQGIAALENLTGRLSKGEVRALLPWLLQNSDSIDPQTWRTVGSLLRLEDLEDIYDVLEGHDLSPLVSSSADSWLARRSYLGLNVARDEDRDTTRAAGWRFRGKTLGLEIDEHRLSIATNGRKLPSRDGASSAPSWESVTDSLRGLRLASVSLKGVARSVRIDAGTSDDIRMDVEEVTSSLEDSYVVTEVHVRLPSASLDDEPVDAHATYAAAVVTASHNASVADLTRASLQILLYRAPLPTPEIEQYLR